MKKLVQYIKESLLDDEEDFNNPFENIKVDVKNIKDLLKTSNFKKVPNRESGKYFDLWRMKDRRFLKLTNDLFNFAGIEVLSSDEKMPALHISFRKQNDSSPEYRKSTIKLGIAYHDINGKTQLIRRDIHLNYDEYQTPKDFIKYLNNLFKDERCIVNAIKDIYENGDNVNIYGFSGSGW
jgi:hypothetical protein